jgi:hypothetical protein
MVARMDLDHLLGFVRHARTHLERGSIGAVREALDDAERLLLDLNLRAPRPALNLENVARLLSAAADAPDCGVRLLYLAEGRSILASETERHHELTLLLDALEGDVVRPTRTGVTT